MEIFKRQEAVAWLLENVRGMMMARDLPEDQIQAALILERSRLEKFSDLKLKNMVFINCF